MPLTAISVGAVDEVLTVEEIHRRLVDPGGRNRRELQILDARLLG